MNPKDREKLILTVGGILAFVVIFFGLFVGPTVASIKKTEKQIISNEKKAGELKTLIEDYKKYASVAKPKFDGSLPGFVEQKAKEMNITVASMNPYGQKDDSSSALKTGRRPGESSKPKEGVEVKVDEMEGKTILQFVYEMEKSGIKVSRLNMKDYKGTGMWNVKMNLEI